jgi:uncharacterized membrane protein YdjX (TVP38/TMEM64 family)
MSRSLIAYFLGASLGNSAIRILTGKTIYFSKQRGEVYLGWLIFVTRLLPVFSFDLISYAAGITHLSLPIYTAATILGMIPSTFLITYMGESLMISPLLSVLFGIIFVVALVGVPMGIRRYNWFNLKDIVHIQ